MKLTLCMWYQHHQWKNPPTDLSSSRYGPASTDSTQWESCPSLIQHTLMDTVSSMHMNECNIYNILIPSSSLMSNIVKYSFHLHHHQHHHHQSMFIYISIIQIQSIIIIIIK